MTPEQFVYWLQKFVEVNGESPNDVQWNLIKKHLQMASIKILNIQQMRKEENVIFFFPQCQVFIK
ncbi:hypothetical protein HL670_03049 [Serratia plymuthica]|uniref:hypothetical protein n=1 Tax=Serratia plymuthica TaxID=82996 RepID=UPI00034CC9EC|nr:hypothetical protein [Serratia plymuthica]QJW56160.1 hypothetical protein HL670_03049 [Serratia plymuthica]